MVLEPIHGSDSHAGFNTLGPHTRFLGLVWPLDSILLGVAWSLDQRELDLYWIW